MAFSRFHTVVTSGTHFEFLAEFPTPDSKRGPGDTFIITDEPVQGEIHWVVVINDQGELSWEKDSGSVVATSDYIIYIDAVKGNDLNTGAQPFSLLAGKKGPIKTIAHLREIEAIYFTQKRITYFAPGTYPWPADGSDYRLPSAANANTGQVQQEGVSAWVGSLATVAHGSFRTTAPSNTNSIQTNYTGATGSLNGVILEFQDAPLAGAQARVVENVGGLITIIDAFDDGTFTPVNVPSGMKLIAKRPNVFIDGTVADGGISFSGGSAVILSQFEILGGHSQNFAQVGTDRITFRNQGALLYINGGSSLNSAYPDFITPPPPANLLDALYITSTGPVGCGLAIFRRSGLGTGLVLENTFVQGFEHDTFFVPQLYGTNSPFSFDDNDVLQILGGGNFSFGFVRNCIDGFEYASVGNPFAQAVFALLDASHGFEIAYLDASNNQYDIVRCKDGSTLDIDNVSGTGNGGFGISVGRHGVVISFGGVTATGASGDVDLEGTTFTYAAINALPQLILSPAMAGTGPGKSAIDSNGNVVTIRDL